MCEGLGFKPGFQLEGNNNCAMCAMSVIVGLA